MVDMDEHSTPYTYTPLTKGEIRLLALSPGDEHDQLQGSFKVVSLERPPPYRAISYAWGDAVLSRKVIVDERQLNITLSLEGALRRLRSKNDEVILWADAVCINQSDLNEKASQVMMMFSIFAKSQSVAVWLGPMTPDDADAFWIMQHFDSMLRELSDDDIEGPQETALAFLDRAHTSPGNCRAPRCRCCGCGQQSSYNGLESIRIGMEAVAQLMSRPYFSRLWIVQELVAGTRLLRTNIGQRIKVFHVPMDMTTRLYCGSHHIALASLIDVIGCYKRLPAFTLRTPWNPAADRVVQLNQLVLTFQSGDAHDVHLLETMFAVKDMACADPRDRVYALRAMTGIDKIASLNPAYNISTTVVWEHLAIYLLTTSGATHFLSPAVVLALAGVSRENSLGGIRHSLPTWAPDFECLSHHSDFKHLAYVFIPPGSAGGFEPFDAMYNTTSNGILQVCGRIIDRIISVLPGSSLAAPEGHMEMSSVEQWIASFLIPWSERCHDFLDAEVTSAAADCLRSRTFLRQGRLDYADADELISLRELETRFGSRDVTPPQSSRLDSVRVLQDLKVIEFRSDYHTSDYRAGKVWIRSLGWDCFRILACTAHGRGCWVPSSSEVGDVVCVLQGAPYPFVLRPSDSGRYNIVGDAYVHGIMDGEAWTDDAGNVEFIQLV